VVDPGDLEVSIHSLLAPRKIPDSPSQNSLLDF
jgi:hypothetical protein